MKKIQPLFFLFILLFVSGCQKTKPPTPILSVGLKTYTGQFITFNYPSSGKLYIISPKESYILGPLIPLYPISIPSPSMTPTETALSTASVTQDPPPIPTPQQGDAKYAYQIHIQLFDNLMNLSTEAWAREHIIHEWKRTQGGPSIYPVSQDGHILENQISHVQIGKIQAIMIDTYGYLDQTRTLYISKDKLIIGFSFTLYSAQIDAFSVMQKDIYALILGTLRWTKS